MKTPKIFLIVMVLISWITIPFLGWKSIKRFLPASLFVAFILMVESYIAKNRRWWEFYARLTPNTNGELPFIIGPFLAGSLWVLKLTFGKITPFIICNVLMNLFNAFLVIPLIQKLKIFTFVKIKPWPFFILMCSKAALLYLYQLIFGEKRHPKKLI